MQSNDLERVWRRTVRRTDMIRAVVIGVLLAVCVIVSAYISLPAGLFTAIGAIFLLAYFWSYTRRRRQQPIAEYITHPALAQAFDRPVFSLPAASPAADPAVLFRGEGKLRCRDMITASWHDLPFTFANLVVHGAKRGTVAFRGQWLRVQADWTLPGTVEVRPNRPDDAVQENASTGNLPALDNAFLRAYHVDTDAPRKAAAVLSCPLIQAMLMHAPGTRLRIDGATVDLAMPSDDPFFQMTGLEENVAQVTGATEQQIAVLQSWLDAIMAVELPEA